MNEYTFNLTNCVRCGKVCNYRSLEDFVCDCGMTIARIGLEEETIYCIYIKLGKYQLYWYDDKTCRLYEGETSEDETILSWMPFDITEDLLNIILTFS